MKKKFYKWYKLPVTKEDTRVEVTKDYFCDGDEYVNEENGFIKLENNYIELEINDE